MKLFKPLNGRYAYFVACIVLAVFFLWSPREVSAITIGKPSNYLLQSGLVGWWTFDANEMGPNVRDRSGQGNHGNLMWQTSTTTAAGKIGQAKFFDGSDDYVNIPDPANGSLDFGANQDFSYSFWFKLTKTTNTAFVSKRAGGGAGHVFYKNSGNYLLGFYDSSSNFYGFNSSLAFTPARDVWTQMTVVFDRDANLSVYIDGVFSTSTSIAAGAAVDLGNSNGFEIGQWSGAIRPYGGLIDDVRIYNRALSASEITALYNSAAIKYNTSATPGSTLTSGLIGHWTFDGKDMGPNVRDVSGQGNHGNLIGQTSTTTVPGKLGQAMSFDGVNDYVDTANIADNLSNFSVSLWLKGGINRGGNYKTIISKLSSGGVPSGVGWALAYTVSSAIPAHRLNAVIQSSASDWVGKYSSTPINDNQWHHAVMVVTNANTVTLYLDGAVQTSVDSSGTLGSYSNANNIRIANDYNSENYNGTVDDVRIYNRALSASEITALYNSAAIKYNTSATPGSTLTSGLIGHWTFDGKDMGPNVRDVSGQGNHGNLIGQTSTTTVAGKLGQAMSFDGLNDLVTVSDNDAFDGTSSISWSFWVNDTVATTYADFFTKGGESSGLSSAWAFMQNDSVNRIRLRMVSATSTFFEVYIDYPNLKGWKHVAVTLDGSLYRGYLNGQLYVSGSMAGALNATTDRVTMGGNVFGADGWKNNMDDVRVYNRTLSASEIIQLYNMGR